MRIRWGIAARSVALSAAFAGGARIASAQPNLPPPPPPPMGQQTELPPPPPPGDGPRATPSQRTVARPATAPTAPAARPAARPRRTDDVVVEVPVEAPSEHPAAVTLNPLSLVWGRLSGNLEVQLVPHHALVVAPELLVWSAGRGGSAVGNGLGFASQTSRGVGIELGYHYYLQWHGALRGPYLGPSLLLGNTSDATVGDPAHRQSYWGLAFDGGIQEVWPSGFTMGGGGGLQLLRMAGATGVAPRLLFQLGWSF